MKLSELQKGEEAIITKVLGRGAFRKRILEMGFVKGKKISIVKGAPLKDPIQYRIMDYEVSLRKSESSLIEVITENEIKTLEPLKYSGTISEEILQTTASEKGNNYPIFIYK